MERKGRKKEGRAPALRWYGAAEWLIRPVRRARLVLRWATVSGSIPGAGRLFRYVTNQPPKANSAFYPYGVGK